MLRKQVRVNSINRQAFDMQQNVTDNAARNRFELSAGGHIAFADYRREDEILNILHVEAPLPLRGTGAAGALMKGIMEIASQTRMKVRPICSYAASWINRHREYQDLLIK